MADFKQAFQLVLAHEGRYSVDPNDPGGETYKGIARKMNGQWVGWATVDNLKKQPGFPKNLDNDIGLKSSVEEFYRVSFWNPIKGDDLTNQLVANSIFDFGVNTGISTSISLAQGVVKANVDGKLGPITLSLINGFNPEFFIAAFTVEKIARYINIVKKRDESKKYFYGWVCRALGMQ